MPDTYDHTAENAIRSAYSEAIGDSSTFSQTPHLTEAQRSWAKKLGVNPAKAWAGYATRDQEYRRDDTAAQTQKELGEMAQDRYKRMSMKLQGSPDPTDAQIADARRASEPLTEAQLKEKQTKWAGKMGTDISEKPIDDQAFIPKAELEAKKFKGQRNGYKWSNIKMDWVKLEPLEKSNTVTI
jgi:hypothetical protein